MQHVGTEVVACSCKPSLPQLLLEGQQEVDRSKGRGGGERVFFFSKYRGRIIKGGRRGEEGGNETGGENQLAFTTGGINFVNIYLLYFIQIL